MKRGLILGATAVVGVVGAVQYPVGAWSPEFLVGAGSPDLSAARTATAGEQVITGDAVQTRFGTVQVAIVVSNGKLTDIQPLQWPDGRNLQYSSYSIPKLVTSALSAQSAEVSVISGATYTSEGFIQSLQSALAKR